MAETGDKVVGKIDYGVLQIDNMSNHSNDDACQTGGYRHRFKGFHHDGSDFRPETLNPGSSGGGSDQRRPGSGGSGQGQLGSGAKKSDGSEFVENWWDPELSFPITFRRIGAGLINMGNTCYLNSVLQCLTYTEPLAAYLQSGRHPNSCHIKNGFCALCAIQEHVSLALQSSKSILPKALVFNLQTHFSKLSEVQTGGCT